MSEYSLADCIFDSMERDGFHIVEHRGRPCEETLTFKNDAGEIRTVKVGLTPVKPRNLRFKLTKPDLSETVLPANKRYINLYPYKTYKEDFSNRKKKGGSNGEGL